MAPGSMPAVTPSMIAANAVKTDELHSAPSRSLKKQVLETYLPALIKTRLRTFFVGLVAGLLLAGIYALVTPSTAPAPAKECPACTPRPASALEQPRAIVPTKARNQSADARKAAAPVAADQQQAPVSRPRSISPRERRRVKSYLAKARRAAKKRQWRRARVFAGKILKIQPVHKGAARLLALANKKTGH